MASLAVLGGLLAVGASGSGTTPTATTCDSAATSPCVRVLFLGNSYTFVNDLPGTFRQLARSGGRNVATRMVAAGGETLAQHAVDDASIGTLRREGWTFVVIQEQSEIPALPADRRPTMEPAARTLVGAAKTAGTRPILLETWAHRDGWPENGLDYEAMQAAVDAAYEAIGSDLATTVAPVGRAWQVVHRADPDIALWQDDGSHPSAAGTYLAACVLYARVFGVSPVGLSETGGLPAAAAVALQEAAAAATSWP